MKVSIIIVLVFTLFMGTISTNNNCTFNIDARDEKQYVDIFLNCELPMSNQCSWKRREHLITITGRYQFKNATKNTCFLVIRNVSRIDIGTWTCEEPAADFRQKSKSFKSKCSFNGNLRTNDSMIQIEPEIFNTTDKGDNYSTTFENPSNEIVENVPKVKKWKNLLYAIFGGCMFFLGGISAVGVLYLISCCNGRFVRQHNSSQTFENPVFDDTIEPASNRTSTRNSRSDLVRKSFYNKLLH